MVNVTVKQGSATTIILARETIARVVALPREVNVQGQNDQQVIAKGNQITPVTKTNNVAVGVMGLQGPQGAAGDPGATGPTGPQGASGDLHYRHIQSIPLTTWTVNHGLGKYPSVSAVDSAGSSVIGDVMHIDMNNCVLSFSSAFSGEAYFN